MIDGSGGLTNGGGGTLVLSGINSFTGGVVVSAGTLRVLNDNGLGDPSNSVAINNATLNVGNSFSTSREITINQATINVDAGQTFTISSQITGTGLTQSGAGTLIFAHANLFTSPLAINGGSVVVSADNVLGNGANSLSFNGGGLVVTAGFTSGRACSSTPAAALSASSMRRIR